MNDILSIFEIAESVPRGASSVERRASSRMEAREKGLKRYFTGKPCPQGHVDFRVYPGGMCEECKRCGARDWKKRNAERNHKYQREWRSNNVDYANALTAAWAKKNRESINKRMREWMALNPGKHVEYHANRRARLLEAEGVFTAAETRAIRKKQRDCCAYCRIKLNGRGHLDHITALSKGGSNWPRNLQWLCAHCNVSKHDKDAIDFAQQRGLLL